MRGLPPLLWAHDAQESQIVQRELLRSRIPRQRTTPLLLRLLFLNLYRLHRQLTCPLYEVTAEIIEESCKEDLKIKRALSMLVAQGSFLFADMEEDLGEALLQRVFLEISEIRNGNGVTLVASVME